MPERDFWQGSGHDLRTTIHGIDQAGRDPALALDGPDTVRPAMAGLM